MDFKKIIPILTIIAVMGAFMVIQPANAVSKTEIIACTWESWYIGSELGTDKVIYKGESLTVASMLRVDRMYPHSFRYLHLYIYDANGKFIHHEVDNSGLLGTAVFGVNFKTWDAGIYKMCFTYEGSADGDWPRAEKVVYLHILNKKV